VISVVLIGLLATLAIGATLRARGASPAEPGLPGWAVAFLLLLGVIGAWRAFYPHEAFARLSIWAGAAGCYAITVLVATGRASLQRIRMGLCVLGGAAALFGLLAPGVFGEPGPSGGPFVNPNHLAALLAGILPLAMAGVIVRGKQSRSKIPRAIFLAGTLLCTSGLIATQSRGGALAAAVGVLSLGILLALRGHARGSPIRAWAGVCALVLILAAFPLTGVFGGKGILHRFHPSEAGTESSAGFRISIWKSSLQAAAEGGPLGWGLGTYAWVYPSYRGIDIPYRVPHAHSDWLEGTVELGWAFPVLVLGAGAIFVRRAVRARMKQRSSVAIGTAVGAFAGLVAVAAHAFVDDPLQIPSLLWTVAVLAGLVSASGNLPEFPSSPIAERRRRALPVLAGAGCAAATLLFASMGWKEIRAEGALGSARAALESLEMERAVALARRATALDSASAEVHAALGQTLAVASQAGVGGRMALAEARRAFETALERNPRDAQAFLGLARVAEARGDTETAGMAYASAVRLDPRSGPALEANASFLLRGGMREEALSALRNSAHSDEGALPRVLTQLWEATEDPALLEAVTPRDADALIGLGSFLETYGRFEEADAAWASAGEIAPGNPEAAMKRVRHALSERDFTKAIELARAALSRGADAPALRRMLGAALAASGQLHEAAKIYTALLADHPSDKRATRSLAVIHTQLGRPEAALQAWIDLTQTTPNDLEAWHERARAHQASGDWEKAVEVCHGTLLADPLHEGCRLTLVDLYLERHLAISAEKVLRGWLARSPQEVRALTRLARLYEARGRWREARSQYERILEVDPENTTARAALSRGGEQVPGGPA
jgi:tetratricopeptide (TPR) repeat protein